MFIRDLPQVTVSDTTIPDPYTPPDGTFNVTGSFAASVTISSGVGSASAVSYGFTGEAGTGMFLSTTHAIGLATNGTERWTITATGMLIAVADNSYDIGASAATRPRSVYVGTSVIAAAGTASSTSYGFQGDLGTGTFLSASHAIGFATNGTERWTMTSGGNIIAVADNSYDIGATGATRPRTAYVGTSLIIGETLTTSTTALLLQMAALGIAGQRDSLKIGWTGAAYDTGAHTANWTAYADVTSNAGVSTWTLQSGIDAGAPANRMTVSDAGLVTVADATITNMTSGSILFAGTNGAVSQDNTKLYWSDTAVMLGIGTNSLSSTLQVTQAVATSGTPHLVTYTGAAHTGLANGEVVDITYNMNRTVQITGGDYSLQRSVSFLAPTYAYTSATVVSQSATVYIDKQPQQGANATLADTYALFVAAGPVKIGGTLGVGTNPSAVTPLLVVQGASSGGNNFVASFTGGTYLAANATQEVSDIVFALNRTIDHDTGAITNQRSIKCLAPTHTAQGASVIQNACTFYIDQAPIASTNVTITNAYSLWIDSGLPRIDSTSANGLVATVLGSVGPTGASTTVQEWLTIDINGTTRYVPCF